MAECHAAPLCVDDQAGGGVDCGDLSRRHEHAAREAGIGGVVQGVCGQGRRQPHRHRFAVLPSGGSLRDGEK